MKLFFYCFVLAILCLIVLQATMISAGDTVVFEANIFQSVVRVSVPDSIFLGDVAPGYATPEGSFLINNTGTTDIKVVPGLVDNSENLFRYLKFKETGGALTKIGSFEINVSKPSAFSGSNTKTIRYKLDLQDFEGNINRDYIGHKASVRFLAVAA